MSNQIMLEVGRYTIRFINLIEDLPRILTAVFRVRFTVRLADYQAIEYMLTV